MIERPILRGAPSGPPHKRTVNPLPGSGPPWEEISHANPVFYIVNAVRYGFLGQADVPVGLCFAVTAALALATLTWSQRLFSTGRKLKP